MESTSIIEKLKAIKSSHGANWPNHADPEDLLSAVLELADEVEALKAQIASGRLGAKVTEIDPEQIAKTTGQT